MKVVHLTRNDFYIVLGAAYKALNINPKLMEVGVLRGQNAIAMHNAIAQSTTPSLTLLIDSWSVEVTKGWNSFEGDTPPWLLPQEAKNEYYGGSVFEQETYDRLYAECIENVKALPNVKIIRNSSIGALTQIEQVSGTNKFDLCYIDATHQYEYVLRDLMYYQQFVAEDGCLMLNDCCFSPTGARLNFGVLEAVGNFLKRAPFRPVALTSTDFSDLMMVRRGSKLGDLLDELFVQNAISYVEVPDQLLPAAKVIQGAKRTNISFI
ncbi:MAG TPA: class I SAM-dependent methyltransferase [Burkholderiaceae bacterium]